jgi:hypothetical protein
MSVQPVDGTKPNGPVAAAFIAAAVGCAVLGVVVVLQESGILSGPSLDFSKNYGVGTGVGPLSGKVIIATISFLATWAGLGLAWRRKEVDFARAFVVSIVLLVVGFALTFPPIFELFAKD